MTGKLKHIHRAQSLLAVMLGLWLFAQPAFPKDNVSRSIMVVVLKNGEPQSGVQFEINGKSYVTNSEGYAALAILSDKAFLRLERQEEQRALSLSSDPSEETFVTIRLLDSQNYDLDAETPLLAEPAPGMSRTTLLERKEPTGGEPLDEIIVLAPRIRGSVAALMEVRRSSKGVSEVLGSDQMSKSGDSDAAAGLRRVTGITLVDGKYVYIRGLGERYTTATLNGFLLPSPEPSRRVVPLDLFPVSVLDSIVVNKSFESRNPGEFGGGLIQLETKSLPDSFFFRGALSIHSGAFESELAARGGKTDAFGFDDGTRALPGGLRDAFTSGKKINTDNFSESEIQDLGRSLTTNYNVTEKRRDLPPGLQLGFGNSYFFRGWKTGFATSILTANSADGGNKSMYRFDSDGSSLKKDESIQTQYSGSDYRAGFSLDHAWSLRDEFRIGFTYLYLRHTSDSVEVKDAKRESGSVNEFRTTEIEWVERALQVRQLKLTGDVYKSEKTKVTLAARGQLANAERDAPDRREYTYENRDGAFRLNVDTKGNLRSWSELSDRAQEIGSDLRGSYEYSKGKKWVWSTGISSFSKSRSSDTLRLKISRKSSPEGDSADLTLPPDGLFSPESFGPDGFKVFVVADAADSMTGEQKVDSVYFQNDLDLNETFTVSAGARQERSTQVVRTFNRFEEGGKTNSMGGIEAENLLPYAGLSWKPWEELRGRIAYSETVARPEFREVAEIIYREEDTDYEVKGNSALRSTVITNIDLRLEYFPSTDELISGGVFQKSFADPIEEVFLPSQNLLKSFDNARSAINRGVELESRVNLRRLDRELRFISASFNVALIDSKIDLSSENIQTQTSKERPLQGQSPWILNTQVQYDRPHKGASLGVVYNVIGPRIVQVGTNARPDIYEQPFHQIDLIASQKLDRSWSVSGRIKNLLDPDSIHMQGDEVFRKQKKGVSFAVSLTGSFQ